MSLSMMDRMAWRRLSILMMKFLIEVILKNRLNSPGLFSGGESVCGVRSRGAR